MPLIPGGGQKRFRVAVAQPPIGGGAGNEHFETISALPEVVDSWTLRTTDQWSERRNGSTSTIQYEAAIDSCIFIIPPRSNKGGGWMFRWSGFSWNAGDKLVVQHDYMLNSNMFGSTVGGKFTNLCRGNDITYELNPLWSSWNPAPHTLRCYLGKLEGRQERDHLASDIANPTATFVGSGGGYDNNPGPDSTFPYNNPQTHPTTFRAYPNQWIRVTYEVENTDNNTARIKMWLASEDTDPRLVIASPVTPSLGFKVADNTPITGMYFELDTSQEIAYAEDQPLRWVAFRNLVVLSNINGASVLGGRPSRNS